MNEGLLWLDADPKRDLAAKVARAAGRYRERFGMRPTTCYVNSGQWPGLPADVGGVRLVPADNVLRHHFWIGVEEGAALKDIGDGNGNGAPPTNGKVLAAGALVCRRCGAEALDPQAASCWACGWDGK
jgi:hypothetical protein